MARPQRARLAVWAGRPAAPERPRLGPADVLYSPPNPDGTRKRCANCLFWLGGPGPQLPNEASTGAAREECFIHDADVIVRADMTCGYHVFGTGVSGLHVPRENMAPVDPELSGLVQTTDGSNCETCTHFRGGASLEGTCVVAFETEGEVVTELPAVVHRNGCCAAWREHDDPT